MDTLEITITLYGGNAGLRHAQIDQWTGQAIVCPRTKVDLLDGEWREQSHRTGVYLLYGNDTEMGGSPVYIGQSRNVRERLRDHEDKEFWSEVILFTSKDDTFDEAHSQYVESQIVQMARDAKRQPVTNIRDPQLPDLSRGKRETMKQFVGNIRVLLGVLGHKTLEPLSAPSDAQQEAQAKDSTSLVFILKGKGVEAEGHRSNDGFVVLAGSGFVPKEKEANSLLDLGRQIRQQLLDEGVVGAGKDGQLCFLRSYTLSSPSQAAQVIWASETNGRTSWKTKEGLSIADIEAAEAAGANQI